MVTNQKTKMETHLSHHDTQANECPLMNVIYLYYYFNNISRNFCPASLEIFLIRSSLKRGRGAKNEMWSLPTNVYRDILGQAWNLMFCNNSTSRTVVWPCVGLTGEVDAQDDTFIIGADVEVGCNDMKNANQSAYKAHRTGCSIQLRMCSFIWFASSQVFVRSSSLFQKRFLEWKDGSG